MIHYDRIILKLLSPNYTFNTNCTSDVKYTAALGPN